MLHHISSCLTLIRLYRGCSYAGVRIRVHNTFADPSPVRVLWLKVHTTADSDARFLHDLYERFHHKWKWRLADKAKTYKKEIDTVESREEHYRVNHFLSFIYHVISHLNSRILQELKAISTPVWVGHASRPSLLYCRAGKSRIFFQKMRFKWQ